MKRYIKSVENYSYSGQYFLEPWDEEEYMIHSYLSLEDAREMADAYYDGRCDIAFVPNDIAEDYVNGDADLHDITYFDA